MTTPTSADLCARAVIASAGALGLNPVAAMVAKGGPQRAAIPPAAKACIEILGWKRGNAARAFGIGLSTISAAEFRDDARFHMATRAAKTALVTAGASLAHADLGLSSTSEAPIRQPAAVSERTKKIDALGAPSGQVQTEGAARRPVDHRPAIRAAIDRLKSKGVEIAVVGVEADKDRLSPGRGGCCWPPKERPELADERGCHLVAVQGRLFCIEHCEALGQKSTPVQPASAVLPEPYKERRLANPEPRTAAR